MERSGIRDGIASNLPDFTSFHPGYSLTKLHETLISAPLKELLQQVEADPMQRKGEIVLLVAGAKPEADAGQAAEPRCILEIRLEALLVKQAALTARITGEKKNRLYQEALALHNRPAG
ncbi:MAG: hypothetical protein L3J26_03780 [Candidatus Polarisedimenticolaceae bacterium]|nr:hypothetical protein [Candidatus Polarisedimenticolaceae bacterium]